MTLHSKEPGSSGENDDLIEIVHRLEAVTRGCETQEFILRRNEMGQLGFHVQQDGVITEVEPCGFAAKAGLKQGSRLVEVSRPWKSAFYLSKSFISTSAMNETIHVLSNDYYMVVMAATYPMYTAALNGKMNRSVMIAVFNVYAVSVTEFFIIVGRNPLINCFCRFFMFLDL